jgi:hypothetical protein
LIGLAFLAFFAVETPISAASWESRVSGAQSPEYLAHAIERTAAEVSRRVVAAE